MLAMQMHHTVSTSQSKKVGIIPSLHATHLPVGCPQLLRSCDRAQQARQVQLALSQVQVSAPYAVVHQLGKDRVWDRVLFESANHNMVAVGACAV